MKFIRQVYISIKYESVILSFTFSHEPRVADVSRRRQRLK